MDRGSRAGPARRAAPSRGRGAAAAPPDVRRVRLALGRAFLVFALVATGLKLVQVQGLSADELSGQAARQRMTTQVLPAERGRITDRDGTPLAFSVEARALYAQPERIAADRLALGEDPVAYKQAMARRIAELVGPPVTEQRLLELLGETSTTVRLADVVTPAQARAVQEAYPEVSAEHREVRRYPGRELAAPVVGMANWRADAQVVGGLVGLESSADALLAGTNGERVVDTAEGSNAVIPGSERAVRPAVRGSDLELTLDADLQHVVQEMTGGFARSTGAAGASVVVLDAATAEVLALAGDRSFDPNTGRLADAQAAANPAVSAPYEPGSVNKVVTVAAAIEHGLVEPDTVLRVPGSIRMADRTVSDAWDHGDIDLTVTGVLARSSNVGTLQLARQVGEERFVDLLGRFGLGERTGVGLPGESPGSVPPREQWSGSTFANLPIGQGLSMTLLQMAGMYQAIANDGLRVPPRIVRAEIGPDGTRTESPRPDGVRVVSPETATTVREMLRAVVQDEPGQRGTAPAAALPGYQVAGKTGTAQQVDEACSCYSQSDYWITFAGILPADAPRFVVGIVVDDPASGGSAAPLFHDVASYLAQRYAVPMSPEPSPVVPLTLPG